MKLRLAIISMLLILLVPGRGGAQTAEAWLDYFANLTLENGWSFEANPGLAKGLAGAQWLDLYLASTAAYQPFNWLNAEGNLEVHYTFDKSTEDVLEVRPWLGLNFIWATFGEYLNIFYPSLSLRLEERFLWYQESGAEAKKTRARIRVATRFPLNNTTLTAGTYYLLFLAETYIPLDGEAREVSADRRRFQGGLGYVIGSDMRIELHYIHMRTLDTYSNKFEASSNIVWLAFRNYF